MGSYNVQEYNVARETAQTQTTVNCYAKRAIHTGGCEWSPQGMSCSLPSLSSPELGHPDGPCSVPAVSLPRVSGCLHPLVAALAQS